MTRRTLSILRSPTTKNNLRVVTPALLVCCLLAAFSWWGPIPEHQEFQQRYRADALADAGGVGAKMVAAMTHRVSKLEALHGFVVAEADHESMVHGFADAWVAYATRLAGSGSEQDVAIKSMELIPDSSPDKLVYPSDEGTGPVRSAVAVAGDPGYEAASSRPGNQIEGPKEADGSILLTVTRGVWVPEAEGSKFWGVARIVIDFDVILDESGFGEPTESGLIIAVKVVDGLGVERTVGEPAALDGDPIVVDLMLDSGKWSFHGVPAEGWPVGLTGAGILVRYGGLAVAAVVGVLIWRLLQTRQRERDISRDLQQLLGSASSAISSLDAQGRIVEWNQAAEKMSGLHRSRMFGLSLAASPMAEMVDGATLERIRTAYGDVYEGRTRSNVELAWSLPEGRTVTALFNIAPRFDADGRVVGAISIGHDISGLKEMGRLKSENYAMARAARAQELFVASMSHELRTPLQAVLGLSAVLRRGTFGSLTDKQRGYVRHIEQAGQHLLALINDVLDLAKIQSGHGSLDLAPAHVSSFASELASIFKPMAEESGLTLHFRVSDDDRTIIVDERRIRQVLMNLMSNAIKFTPAGGDVGLEVGYFADGVKCVVWDTGIGVEPSDYSRVFEPFVQLDTGLDRNHDGSGLGLAISRRIIELHGGTVEVVGAQGRGSRFTVWLPLSPPRVQADPYPGSNDMASGDQVPFRELLA